MNSLILFAILALSGLRDTVAVSVLCVIVVAGFASWYLSDLSKKWEEKAARHNTYIRPHNRPVDFPQPLLVEVSQLASNYVVWNLPAEYVEENLVSRLQTHLEKDLNHHGKLSIKVYGGQDGIWINLKKDSSMESWNQVKIEAKECFREHFERSIEFTPEEVEQVASN